MAGFFFNELENSFVSLVRVVKIDTVPSVMTYLVLETLHVRGWNDLRTLKLQLGLTRIGSHSHFNVVASCWSGFNSHNLHDNASLHTAKDFAAVPFYPTLLELQRPLAVMFSIVRCNGHPRASCQVPRFPT